MKQTRKRFLAVVMSLALIVGLLPAMSVPAAAEDTVTKRTTTLDLTSASEISYAASGSTTGSASPSSANITDTTEGWAWYHTATGNYAANTLVLNGIDFSISAQQYGIILPSATTVVVNGANTISLSLTTIQSIEDYKTCGLYSKSGILNITGTDAEANSLTINDSSTQSDAQIYAIYADALNVDGVTMTVNADTVTTHNVLNMAFYTQSMTVGAATAANIAATGGKISNSNRYNYAIYVSTNFTLTRGSVTATGAEHTGADSSSYGLYVYKTLTVGADATSLTGTGANGNTSIGISADTGSIAGGTVTGTGGAISGKTKSGVSCGISILDLTVSGGTVSAIGGSVPATWKSEGMGANFLTVTGGTVTATGDAKSSESYGVYGSTGSGYGLKLSGGTVTATGATNGVYTNVTAKIGTDLTATGGTSAICSDGTLTTPAANAATTTIKAGASAATAADTTYSAQKYLNLRVTEVKPTVAVAAQSGTIYAGSVNSATFAVTATNFTQALAADNFTTAWCDSNGNSKTGPTVITLTPSVSGSTVTLTAATTAEATAGTYYFTLTAVSGSETATSSVVTLTVSLRGITFNTNTGETATTTTAEISSGAVTLPTDPTRADYHFAGWWYMDSNGVYTKKFVNSGLTDSATVYAMWKTYATSVYVNNIDITDGGYWKNDDTATARGSDSDYNFHYDKSTGVLTLNDAQVSGTKLGNTVTITSGSYQDNYTN